MVEAVLHDWRTAPISPRLRAMLGFLELMTLHPEHLSKDDIIPLNAEGISDQAIEDALEVCALFNIYARLADAFNFEIPPEAGFQQGARMLLKRGYA